MLIAFDVTIFIKSFLWIGILNGSFSNRCPSKRAFRRMRIRRDATQSHNSCQPVKGIDPTKLKVFVYIACPQQDDLKLSSLARAPVTSSNLRQKDPCRFQDH
ncbi:hypothetical protein PoB_001270900 [Plakobranchus ocellatus]|uniref:Secreted protein n=1 Tax=Plakobranchus ocellatus TaxID=259542 RepID=A0AAV3YSZ3_9GAST|nr:hypothetical protein PoB_001270900 [Plakobranchus ocellatus]